MVLCRLAVKVQGGSVEAQGGSVDSLIAHGSSVDGMVAQGKAVVHHQLIWFEDLQLHLGQNR